MAEETLLVGIDVSRRWLDVHLHPVGEALRVANDAQGHALLAARLEGQAVLAVGLEASGGYEKAAAEALVRAGHTVRLLDPARVRAFARAIGQRAKTDPIDARIIARYVGQADGAMLPPDPVPERLRALVTQRTALIAQRKALLQQLERLGEADLQALLQPLLAQVASAIAKIESLILTSLKAGAEQRAKAALLGAVPGVGPILTAILLARLPELGHLASRKIAALAGLAPYDRQSGERHRRKRIHGGRHDLRAVLYMATLSAVRANPPLKRFHDRLRAQGKPPKLVLVACMRKLLTWLNTMLKNNQPWQPTCTASHS